MQRKPPLNIRLSYCYRDAGNNKQHGSVMFMNDTGKTLEEIETAIRSKLIDGLWFVAEEWGLPDLRFENYEWDEELDHGWHELVSVEEIGEMEGGKNIMVLLNR